MNNLKDHIDDPIKRVVAGLNLLGIKTAMSCCGFTYKGETVPKTHLEKAYVYINWVNTPKEKYGLILELAIKAGWNLGGYGDKFPFMDFYANHWDEKHPWRVRGCVHNYEMFILMINALERVIATYEDQMAAEVTIHDGNSWYREDCKIKYWQYEPAEPWTVTKEEYKTL